MDQQRSASPSSMSPETATTFKYRPIGRCASPPVYGCYELDNEETDSDNDNESHSGSEDGDEAAVVVDAVDIDPASIPLPPSPDLPSIPMDAEPSDPSASVEAQEAPLPTSDMDTTTEILPKQEESTPDTPIIVDAVATTPEQPDNDSAPAKETNDSLLDATDAQLGDSVQAQHLAPTAPIDQAISTPSHQDVVIPIREEDAQHPVDATLNPLPTVTAIPVAVDDTNAKEVTEIKDVSTEDLQVVDVAVTQDEDKPDSPDQEKKDADEAEAYLTDCGRPSTLTKIDKGKGREVVVDPTSSSTEASNTIPVSVPVSIVTSEESSEQNQDAVYTPPTPSSRTRQSSRREKKERVRRIKYQPLLTLRSSQGWIWNQDLFVPHYMKDRYITYPPDPYHGNPSQHPHPSSHSSSGSSNGIQTPAGIEYDCVAIALTAEDMDQLVPP